MAAVGSGFSFNDWRDLRLLALIEPCLTPHARDAQRGEHSGIAAFGRATTCD
jgi:hypothetical protein